VATRFSPASHPSPGRTTGVHVALQPSDTLFGEDPVERLVDGVLIAIPLIVVGALLARASGLWS
jgi:hypothetical protein